MSKTTKQPRPPIIDGPPIEIKYQDEASDDSIVDWSWMLGLLAGIILGLLIAKLF